jgi:hypothetical protein
MLTWPADGHGENDDEEEEGDDGEPNGQVAPPVVQPQLLRVPLQEALLLLPAQSSDRKK